jgi:hypothetical protein
VGRAAPAAQEWAASRQRLRDAVVYFQQQRELPELARTQLEVARTYRAMGESGEPAVEALRVALGTAEASRRPQVVRVVEQELRAVNAAAYYARLHRRVWGADAGTEAASLISGTSESATVLFLDIKGSTVFTRDHDPAEVLLTINHVMAS